MKISNLPTASNCKDEDVLPIVQNGRTKKVSKKTLLSEVLEKIKTLNDNGLILKDSVIKEQVLAWIEDNPTSTSTIRDGSILPEQFHNDTKEWIRSGTLNAKDFGASGDGSTNDALGLYDLFDNITDNTHVVFPKGHYVIKSFPSDFVGSMKSASQGKRYWFFRVNGKKNITIDLNDSVIELKLPKDYNGDGFPRYSIFLIQDCENFIIKNGTIVGDRKTHDYTLLDIDKANVSKDGDGNITSINHEWGCGVSIKVTNPNTNVCNGLIENLTVSECIGDGINLYNGSVYSPVSVKNCEVFNCRRQGITVGDTNNITIDGCYIHHVGTHYKVFGDESSGLIEGSVYAGNGIDLEAEGGNYKIGTVNILNTTLKNNTRFAITASGAKKYSIEKVNVFNCDITGVLCFSSYSNISNEIITPVLIRDSIITHDKYYETPDDKVSGAVKNKSHIFDNTKAINCVFNSYNNDSFYVDITNYALIMLDKDSEKGAIIENSVFNLTDNTKLNYCQLVNCIVNGGIVQSYEQQPYLTIRNCYNTNFNKCGLNVKDPLQKYKMVNCSFIDCFMSDKPMSPTNNGRFDSVTQKYDNTVPKGLSLRNCYLNSDFLKYNDKEYGDYKNCTFENGEVTE